MLRSAAIVADCSLHRKSAIQDLQVLAGAQQRLIVLEQRQIILHTAHLPPRACRSWQKLRSIQQHWSCGRLFPTPHICHPGLAGPGRRSAALELRQIVPHTPHLTSRTYRSWQELSSIQQHWSCGSLFPTLHICHPGPAGPNRCSATLSNARAVADCSPHPTSIIEDLQIKPGAQQCSVVLKLWQIVLRTANLPSKTCRS